MATLDGLGCQTVDGLGGTGARSNHLGFHTFILEFTLKFQLIDI